MLAKSKLNSTEKLVSQALINLEIISEEYKSIINKEENYRRLKESIRMMKSSNEKEQLNENNKNNSENCGNAQIQKNKYFLNIYKKFKNSVEVYEKNGIEVIIDDNGTLWLNEKHIEEKLGHKNLTVIKKKYNPIYKKHRYELIDQPNNQPNERFLRNDLALKDQS